jgi:hypothetical protein
MTRSQANALAIPVAIEKTVEKFRTNPMNLSEEVIIEMINHSIATFEL